MFATYSVRTLSRAYFITISFLALYGLYTFGDVFNVRVWITPISLPHAYNVILYSSLFFFFDYKFKFLGLVAFLFAESLSEVTYNVFGFWQVAQNWQASNSWQVLATVSIFLVSLYLFRRYGFALKNLALLCVYSSLVYSIIPAFINTPLLELVAQPCYVLLMAYSIKLPRFILAHSQEASKVA